MKKGILGVLLFAFIYLLWEPNFRLDQSVKINGISLVSPRKAVDSVLFDDVSRTGANYVAIIPYAFTRRNQTNVLFDLSHQWWGERKEGVIQLVQYARDQGMEVMVKPHVWIEGQGWAGDFDLLDELQWKEWEVSYENYILHYANLADSLQVPLFCIGTEFRMAVQKRGPFWKNLIKKVRAIYSGQITYAANWDNYQLIDFWSELDYIGIDAYFPLIEVAQPTLSQLLTAWGPEFERLKSLSADYQKPILFTEFGYQSLTGTTGKHWQLNNKNTEMESQRTAYEAILNKFWDVPWFAGGFLWKWHLKKDAGGLKDPNFTPQGKPALEVITKYYKSHTRHSVAIK